jgi:DNA-binding NarL/FixJ family response regulator
MTDTPLRSDFLLDAAWSERPVRVLIGDDHSLFRRGLVIVFEEEGDLDVLGEGDQGPELVALAEELAPDVILVDAALPPYGGVAAIAQINRTVPTARIVLVTADESDPTELLEGIGAGAVAVMVKELALDEGPVVVRRVAGGRSAITPAVAGAIRDFVKDDPEPAAGLPKVGVTERERVLVDVLARGADAAAAGQGLDIDETTAENLLLNVVRRLQRFWRADDIVLSLSRRQPDTGPSDLAEAAGQAIDGSD